jgi:hypothetical protein
MKADNIIVHSVVEECQQLWLRDFGIQKISGKCNSERLLRSKIPTNSDILRREEFCEKVDEREMSERSDALSAVE